MLQGILKYFSQSTTRLLKLKPDHIEKNTLNITDSNLWGIFGKNKRNEGRMLNAHLAFQDAVRVLSKGQQQMKAPVSSIIIENSLKKFQETRNFNDLSLPEIEEFAKIFYEGRDDMNIEVDTSLAVQLWSIAAEKGSLNSKYCLAVCKRDGKGIDKDAEGSFKILIDLADNDESAIAQYDISIMYAEGIGINQNFELAFEYGLKAARNGILPATLNVANAYANGIGVERNDEIAIKYYQVASLAGDLYSKFILATWTYKGRGVTRDLNRSFQLQKEAAESGFHPAMFNLGCHYLSGEGTQKDFAEAIKWFQSAAYEGNIPEAGVNLANMYLQGLGVDRNLEKAKEVLERFASTHLGSRDLLREIHRNQENIS